MTDWNSAVGELLTACRDQFGRTVIYTPSGGDPVEISGIFDRNQESMEIDAAGMPVVYQRNVLFLLAKDIPFTPSQGDRARIDETTYRVDHVQNSEPGGYRLLLNRE